MSGAVTKRQPTELGIGTRARILATAHRLFAERGYAGTSVRMIARELGLSDPAIHYHFPTKQGLYRALLEEPDYGALPLDFLPLSRSTMVDQVLHLFGWWAARPEFGQMLLREQLASDAASVAFLNTSDAVWAASVTAPLCELAGEEGEDVSAMLFEMLAGVFWDAILSYRGHFAETIAQPYFTTRLRKMVDRAIPAGSSDD